jgi:protein SCO1/2
MNATPRHPSWLVLGALGLTVAIVVLALALELVRQRQSPPPPRLYALPEFTLTNQHGQAVTLRDLRGLVWIADIIFTRCAGPCPVMTQSLKSLQDVLHVTSSVKLVTLTTDPEFDTPPVLKKYAERFGADSNRWMFLTGTKMEIGKLAANSLKLSAVPVKPEEQKDAADLFIHTTIFVIVDKRARLRGTFETQGEGVEWTKVQARIIATVRQLESE